MQRLYCILRENKVDNNYIMYCNRILLTTAIAFSCFALACGPKSLTDQDLATDIQGKLYANDATKAANVSVAVNGGIVTLSGDVPTSDVELQAMKIANGVTGVKSVNDQMKVAAAAAMPASAAPPSGPPIATPLAANPGPAPQSPPVQAAPPPMTAAAPPPGPPARVDSAPRPAVRREPVTYTIPAGERLAIRMIDSIDTKVNTEGQTFRASLDSPLTSEGRVIVPVGAPVTVLLASAKAATRIKGNSELEVRVTGLEYHGQNVEVNSSVYAAQGAARGKQTAVRSGIGAGLGALIGAVAGGGKGAAIGGLAGGGAGAGFQLATHGQQVKIPAETQLSFRLEAPLTFTR
jgi:BON domain